MNVSVPPGFGVSPAAAETAISAAPRTTPRPAVTHRDFLIIASLLHAVHLFVLANDPIGKLPLFGIMR
jgi:hypothetical protein